MTSAQFPEDFLNDWPDGTPKSFGTAFTGHMDGQPSIFVTHRIFCPANSTGVSASHHATASREKVEAGGRNIGTIFGLSKVVPKTQQDAKRFHVTLKGTTA